MAKPPEPRSWSEGSDAKWFNDEVQPHEVALRGFLRRTFPAVRDIEDVVQESYLRAWKARAGQPIRSMRAFLFTVARRVALNIIERQNNADTIAVGDFSSLPVLSDSPSVVEHVSQDEHLAILVEALATLPARCREITVLRKLKDVPQREVACRLGIAEKTVEEQVARGMRRCQEYFRRRKVL